MKDFYSSRHFVLNFIKRVRTNKDIFSPNNPTLEQTIL